MPSPSGREDFFSSIPSLATLVADPDEGIFAASTHPFASWREQAPTPGERYRRFASTYQESVRRALVGGMHIHAGFGDEDSRIRVMTALRRYLPFLHALSASSPFNGGHETGFKSFRLTVMGALPRTGLPSPLHSRAEYERLVAEYLRMDYIGDARELWWDIRPASAFPTIELRICDVCTRLEDAVSIAALYASLIRWLLRHDRDGTLPPEPHTELIFQDRWIAQRYGVLAFFGDRASGSGRIDIDDYAAAIWWKRSRTTPARSAARRRCAARSPSSETGPVPTARSISTACAALRATARRRPCTAWWTRCWPSRRRGSGKAAAGEGASAIPQLGSGALSTAWASRASRQSATSPFWSR